MEQTCLPKSKLYRVFHKNITAVGFCVILKRCYTCFARRSNSLSRRFSGNRHQMIWYIIIPDEPFFAPFCENSISVITSGIDYRVLLLSFVFYLDCRHHLLICRQISENWVPRSRVFHAKYLARNQTAGTKYIQKKPPSNIHLRQTISNIYKI